MAAVRFTLQTLAALVVKIICSCNRLEMAFSLGCHHRRRAAVHSKKPLHLRTREKTWLGRTSRCVVSRPMVELKSPIRLHLPFHGWKLLYLSTGCPVSKHNNSIPDTRRAGSVKRFRKQASTEIQYACVLIVGRIPSLFLSYVK